MGYGGDTTQYHDTPKWYDPLGPTSIDPKTGKQLTTATTGAIPIRQDIYSREQANQPQIDATTGQVVSGLRTAATDPGWAAGQDLARRTIQGDYLAGSPQLDAAMETTRRAQLSSAADTAARNQSAYARNGLSYSTANQQADAGTMAAAAAAAGNTEAQARLANYEQERGRQIQGVDQLQNATSAPLNYLQNVTPALTNPLATEASLVSGLATGGPIATPQSTIVKQPGVSDYITGAVSSY